MPTLLTLAPTRRWLRLALLAAFVLGACQPAASTAPAATVPAAATDAPANATSAAPDEPTPVAADPTAAPNPGLVVDPLAVSPALDASGAVGQVVGPEGGTLTATGADGAAFSLTIPEGSLLVPMVISMTPVTALDNLPLSGGLAGGVQLEPDGLWLMLPATLIITPALALDPARQDFFAYRGAGDDWHAYPPLTSTAALALSVQHFSGYGVGSGTEADRAQLAAHSPADTMAQIEAVIAELFRQEKELFQTTGRGDPQFQEKLNEQIQKGFDLIVQPTVEAALQTDDYDVIAAALKLLLSWERFAALAAAEDFLPEKEYTGTVMQELVLHGVTVAGQECVEQHKFERLATLFMLERTMGLLGSEAMGAAIGTALDAMRACLHFELTFVSVITEGGFGDPYGYRYELKGTIPLGVPDGNNELVKGRLVGVGTLDYVSVAWIGEPRCTFAAAGVDAVLNLRDGVNGVPYPIGSNATTISITYDPGLPAEDVTMSCPRAEPLTWHTTAWQGYFDIMHVAEKVGTSSYRLVTPMLGGDIIARSQQHLTTQGPSGQEVIEDTLIQIVHTPVK